MLYGLSKIVNLVSGHIRYIGTSYLQVIYLQFYTTSPIIPFCKYTVSLYILFIQVDILGCMLQFTQNTMFNFFVPFLCLGISFKFKQICIDSDHRYSSPRGQLPDFGLGFNTQKIISNIEEGEVEEAKEESAKFYVILDFLSIEDTVHVRQVFRAQPRLGVVIVGSWCDYYRVEGKTTVLGLQNIYRLIGH